ncbi:hypothetical protein LB553_01035 [Mesorhizobium sp. CA8]|uniref:hypothetical protein n=1 Tax=Mesorhizobium sp. CA8 TaxID=2876637 RepID=UPI001CCC338F|nr:hypothetical protein [Mesorhizobium sp. CA8]MBZ9759472.1 hypothetical protein [Mesorhizobium sp. CA8]
MLEYRHYIMGMSNSFDSLAEIMREGSKPSHIGFIVNSFLSKFASGLAIGAGVVLVLAIAKATGL